MNGIIFVIYGFSSSTQCYHQLMESTTHRSKQIAVVIMWISRGLRIYKLNCWDIYYTYMCICLVVIHTNTIFFRGIPDLIKFFRIFAKQLHFINIQPGSEIAPKAENRINKGKMALC